MVQKNFKNRKKMKNVENLQKYRNNLKQIFHFFKIVPFYSHKHFLSPTIQFFVSQTIALRYCIFFM